MQSVGKGLSVGVTAPLVGLGVVAVKTFADFEQQMAAVKAISGATGVSFAALEKSALDLGAATRFTSSQVAELQLNYSKLGFSPDEIIQVTAATLDLALATGSDLANSATVAASTLRGFGLEATEMQRVVDIMASSFSGSALDLEKFQTAMGTLAPVAKNAGVSIEEATSYLALLVDRGVDASTAGTGLRNIFLDLAGSGETLGQAMLKISTSTNKNKEAFEAFGKRGATVAAIMADNSAEAKELEKSFINSGGSAKRMAEIMDNTAQGSLFRMKSAIEGASIALGEVLIPYIKQAADFVAGLAKSFKELSPETKKNIVLFGAIAAAVGPALVVLGFLMTSVVPGLITAFGFLRASMLLLQTGFLKLTAIIAANPFGALAVAIAAVASYFIFFNNKVDDTIDKQNLLADVNDRAAKSIANEKAKLAELLFIARDESIVKSARIKAIKELNKLSPEFLGNLTLEKINTDLATSAVKLYNQELLKSAKTKAAQSKLQAIQSELIDIELSKERQSVNIAKQKSGLLNDENLTVADKNKLLGVTLKNEKLGDLLQVDKLATLKAQEAQLLKIIAANQTINKVVSAGSPPVETDRKKASVLDTTGLAIGVQSFNLSDGILDEDSKIESGLASIKEKFLDFGEASSQIISGAASNALASFGEMIGGLLSGSLTMGDVAGGLMSIIGDLAMQLGKAAIQIGVGMLAVKAAFANPFTAIAAGVALVALGALIKSTSQITSGGGGYAGAFANGGVVGGSSFSGDRLFARVNSGEMVLNQKQQGNLAGMLNPATSNVNVVLQPSIDFSGRKFKMMLNQVDNALNRTR